MGKAADNKQKKREALLNTAFKLFTTKGINNTSVSDITEQAGVAKGTFYLYFKDKYDINNILVAKKATLLFDASLQKMKENNIQNFIDKLLFITNDIVDALSENRRLLTFISKNLGLGVFRFAVENAKITENPSVVEAYQKILEGEEENITNPKLMFYMIIELVGGCIYSSILYSQPVPIEELKPHLDKTIVSIVEQFKIK